MTTPLRPLVSGIRITSTLSLRPPFATACRATACQQRTLPPLSLLSSASPSPSHPRRFLSHTPRRQDHPTNDPKWQDELRRRYRMLAEAEPLVRGDRKFFPRLPPSWLSRLPLKTMALASAAGALALYFSNLETVPVSGRRRFNIVSEALVEYVAELESRELMERLEGAGKLLPGHDRRSIVVRNVMRNLIPASGLARTDWEVYVIDEPRTANAFVLPNRKVFVFSGILPLARSEAGLAAVLGHEVAHTLAQHVGERMSSALGANVLLACALGLSVLLGPAALFPLHYIGSSVLDVAFRRPMDRRHEAEADHVGLMIMADAGFDPRAAVQFWENMERATRGRDEPPEVLSTHPSNQHRIESLREWMPEAMERWQTSLQSSEAGGGAIFADLFRRAMRGGYTLG